MADRKFRVLLAEDEPFHRFPYRASLERLGFEVVEAEDFDGVVAQGLAVDALVIDARLPTERLEGLKAAAWLVAKGLRANVPLVFISVYAERVPNVQQALQALPELHGRYDWIEKPFEPTTLASLLSLKLRDGRLSDERR